MFLNQLQSSLRSDPFESARIYFQAEDGIRVMIVTGVQTCALTIYLQLDQLWIDLDIGLSHWQFSFSTDGQVPDKPRSTKEQSVIILTDRRPDGSLGRHVGCLCFALRRGLDPRDPQEF